jgi:large subunit ribosomal protein L10
MLKREDKKKIVAKLAQDLSQAKAIVLNEFHNVPAKEIQELRVGLRKEQVGYKVVKISLLKKVLEKLGIDTASYNYQVPLAIGYSNDDEVAPARILQKFAKTHENFKILGGYLGKDFVDAEKVRELSALPDKVALRGQLASVIIGPVRGLVSVMAGDIRGLLNILSKIKS